MPIDASIPLQVQNPKFESPMNQLAMMAEASKIGEMQQAGQERNALRQRMAQGDFDVNNPAHRKELMAIAPTTAPKMLEGLSGTEKNFAQGAKASWEVQSAKADKAIKDIASHDTPDSAFASIQENMKNGTLPPEHGQMLIQQLQTMPFASFQMKQIKGLLTAKDQWAAEHLTAGEQARLNEDTRNHNLIDQRSRDRLAQETAVPDSVGKDAIELGAQLYLKTGQLPPLGMGKNVAKIKGAMMNRAAEIFKEQNGGTPPPVDTTVAPGANPPAAPAIKPLNMGDAADNIITNKQNIHTQGQTLDAFNKGEPGQKVRNLNTAIDHSVTILPLIDAIKNGNSADINRIANNISARTGGTAPTNLNLVKTFLADEVSKTLIANGGGEREREHIQSLIDAANSPTQLKDAVKNIHKLLGGQMNSLKLQYETGTGRKDFEKHLSPATQEALRAANDKGGSGGVTAIKDDAGYNALPSGAMFTGPDGVTRRKP